jgi:hypothetical protein
MFLPYLLTVNFHSYFYVYEIHDKKSCSGHIKNYMRHQFCLLLDQVLYQYCTVSGVYT